jgi:hypothetical protein
MRIVFDECVPRTLRLHLPGYKVTTLRQINATGLENGALLDLLERHCDAFITTDQNMQHQQRLANRTFAVIVLYATSNAVPALLPLVPELDSALQQIKPGVLRHVGQTTRTAADTQEQPTPPEQPRRQSDRTH